MPSVQCDEQAAVIRRRKGRRGDDLERRAIFALNFVQVGELSSARALEGAEIAPDTSKRPDRLLNSIPQEVMEHVPAMPFTLDQHIFLKNVRSAKRGIGGEPSGMTVEHLRPLLDSPRDHRLLHTLAEGLAQGVVFESIVDAVRLGRMAALSKPDGWGIVVGDVVRRLVSRTMAQQMSAAVESAIVPFQCALMHCTRSARIDRLGSVHNVSIDGISAFDQISRYAGWVDER